MDQTKQYYIPVGSKKEYRKIKFLLNAIGHTNIEPWSESSRFSHLLLNGPGHWILVWSELGEELKINDILDDLIKVLPKPAKTGSVEAISANQAEQVMSKMATEDKTEPDYPFKECAVRVKNRKQLVEVFKYLGLTKLDALYITGSVEAHSSYDNVCVSLNNQKPSLDTDIAKAGLNLGSQDYFRKLEYYIMEYNNFKRKTEKI